MNIKQFFIKPNKIILISLLTISALGMGLILYNSIYLDFRISQFDFHQQGEEGLLSLLHSTRNLIIISSFLLLFMSCTLGFTVYYFLKRQNKILRAVSIIRKSQNRYRFFTEAPPSIGIIRFDLIEGKLLDANRAAQLLFGKTRADIVGKSLLRLFPETEITKIRNILSELRAGKSGAEVNLKIRDNLDRERYISLHITNLKNPDIGPEAVAIVLDVTDKLKAEQERIEKERLAGVLEMAGATAHELNQPLQVISGISWMMLQKLKKDDPLYQKIEKIYNEVDRMTKIANKISSVSTYKVKKYVGKTRIIDIERAASAQNQNSRTTKLTRLKNT